MRHHGTSRLGGLEFFRKQAENAGAENASPPQGRFGRVFDLPPLHIDSAGLRALGAPGGPMDGGRARNPTRTVPVGHIFFGQFVDHDITLDVASSLTSDDVPEDIPNQRTPTLDLDSLYGLGPELQGYLYQSRGPFRGVKLLTGADGTAATILQPDGSRLPQEVSLAVRDLPRNAQGTAIIGDPRNDEHRILSQLHLAMLNFHNQVAEHLGKTARTGGQALFERARQWTTWHYQWIVIHDFLCRICGEAVVRDILADGRRFCFPDAPAPFIPVEFSAAAYRFGHSMIPWQLRIYPNGRPVEVFGLELGNGFGPLADGRATIDWKLLVDPADPQLQVADRLDCRLSSDLLDLPFLPEDEFRSLATRNLLRGQTFFLPSGERVAEAMGRPSAEIEMVRAAAREIAESPGDFSRGVPLWFYILVEGDQIGRETEAGRFEPGEGLGPIGARIVAETLIGCIQLDPRSFLGQDRRWTPDDGVGASTLAKLFAFTA